MISRIFRQSQTVIADIGPLTNEPEGEIPIQKPTLFLAVLQNYLYVPTNTWLDARQDFGILKSFNLYSSADLVRLPLLDMLSRPWFRRVWIIQEFILTEQFIVIIANTRISGLHLLHGLARMIEYPQYLSPTREGHNRDAAPEDPAVISRWTTTEELFTFGWIPAHLVTRQIKLFDGTLPPGQPYKLGRVFWHPSKRLLLHNCPHNDDMPCQHSPENLSCDKDNGREEIEVARQLRPVTGAVGVQAEANAATAAAQATAGDRKKVSQFVKSVKSVKSRPRR